MSFCDLLKIEFIKVKRSKIVPLIFIAPLLVVTTGVASLSHHFTPESTNAWSAMFIQSTLLYAYYLLPLSMIVVCVLIAGRETGNSENAGFANQPICAFHCQVLRAGILSVHGGSGLSCRFPNCRDACNTDNGSDRGLTGPLSAATVPRLVSDNAAEHWSYVGNYCTV